MQKIARHFDCVHAHPNNAGGTIPIYSEKYKSIVDLPRAMELTFYRKSINHHKYPPQVPHPLDFDCAPEQKSVILGIPWNMA